MILEEALQLARERGVSPNQLALLEDSFLDMNLLEKIPAHHKTQDKKGGHNNSFIKQARQSPVNSIPLNRANRMSMH